MVSVEGHSPGEGNGPALEATLRAALRGDRFLFAFQPVVCAATGKVDYYECLLRMRDEQGTIVGGVEFIRNFEDLGLIGLIDHYVLEKTVRELATAEIKQTAPFQPGTWSATLSPIVAEG